MIEHFTIVEDDLWDDMVANFKAHPKPKKWKYRLHSSSGQHHVAFWCYERFWHNELGKAWEIRPIREALQMEQEKDVMVKGASPTNIAALYKRGFEAQLAETLTYKHKAKKHPIRVCTKPGDPVRG